MTMSCSLVFFYVLPRHMNIMTDKGFNIFHEWAARCVHLFPQEGTVKWTHLAA